MTKTTIATTTFYRNIKETRFGLAMKTVCEAQRHEYPMVIVDGGSPDEVCRQFQKKGAHLFHQEKSSMGAGRRQAIAEAFKLAQTEVVVWLEPEKFNLISYLNDIVRPIAQNRADLVVPGRKDMSSYPREQEHAERLGNLIFYYLTRRKLDVWFGPRAMNRRAADYFLAYESDYGDKWDSIFIPLLRAIKNDLKVEGVIVNYIHPFLQTSEETGNWVFIDKRIKQLQNLIPSLHQEAQKLGLNK